MITEGKGRHAPKPVRQELDRHTLWLCFNAAASISKGRGYADSNDSWKRGLTGSVYVPRVGFLPSDYAPRFVGNAGEAALICFLNSRMAANVSLDDRFRRDGDKGVDVDLWGLTCQVKTRQSGKSHAKDGLSLVRYATSSGCVKFPNTTTIICCELAMDDFSVSLLGWMYTLRARELPQVPARRGNHINVEISDRDLEPMSSFVDLLAARRGLVA